MGKLLKLLAVFIVVLVIAGIALFIYIDSIAKAAIERGGTYALGVSTTLDSADVGVLSGEFSMSGLNVANPDGFDTSHFLNLAEGGVAVTLGTLREEVIKLPHLTLSALDVNLERNLDGSSNYGVVLENLKRFESKDDKPADQPEDGARFIVRRIEIRDVVVHINAVPQGGDLTTFNFPIEEIVLNDVGSESNRGVLMGELLDVIVKAIIEAVREKGGDILPPDLLSDLEQRLAQLESLDSLGIEMAATVGEDFEKKVNEIQQQLEGKLGEELDNIGNDLGENLGDDAGEGLGNILGGDDDEGGQ